MGKPRMPITGLNILRLLRDGKARNSVQLQDLFGGGTLNEIFVLETAEELVKLRFIDKEPKTEALTISYQWQEVQRALGISLTDLAEYGDAGAMFVKPFFGVPADKTSTADIFVLMPFRPELKPIYTDHIATVATSLSLSVQRADDLFGVGAVMGDIWSGVRHAKVIVADCTGRNPNVFYEVGLAHVLGKPVILVTQNSKDVPFDLRAVRYIEYQYTPRGMQNFERALAETLRSVLGLRNSSAPFGSTLDSDGF